MRRGFGQLTCADFGEQQQSPSSKELQSQRERKALDAPEERATQVRGRGCVLGTSCRGACFLSTHWAPSWPPVLASLTSLPGEEFIFAASCAAAEKKKKNQPSILSSKILFEPSGTVAKGGFWPANGQGFKPGNRS